MKLSENLLRKIERQGFNQAFLNRSWILRLCTKLQPNDLLAPIKHRNNIIGVSEPFKNNPPQIRIQIIKTGTFDHAAMTPVVDSMVQTVRRITALLKEMEKAGRSPNEMLEVVSTIALNPDEEHGDFMIISGADLNLGSIHFLAGDTCTIEHLEFKP